MRYLPKLENEENVGDVGVSYGIQDFLFQSILVLRLLTLQDLFAVPDVYILSRHWKFDQAKMVCSQIQCRCRKSERWFFTQVGGPRTDTTFDILSNDERIGGADVAHLILITKPVLMCCFLLFLSLFLFFWGVGALSSQVVGKCIS